MRLQRLAGFTILAALLAAPFMLMTRPAQAIVTEETICYFGEPRRPLGIIIQVDPDLADALVRGHIASYAWNDTGRSFRGFDVCRPLFKRRR